MAKNESATHYVRTRDEMAEALGLDTDNLSALQELRLDTAVGLKLASDALRAALMRGEEVDHKELLAVTDGLAKLLPREREPDAAVPALYKQDPYKVLEDIVDRWIAADEADRRERGLSLRIHDEEAQQRRIDDLELELVRLRGAQPHALPAPESDRGVIDPPTSAITPPSEQSDSARNLYRGAPRPPPGYDSTINGLWKPPEPVDEVEDDAPSVSTPHVSLPVTCDSAESWRDYVRPDGSISSYPLSGTKRD